MHDNPNSGDAAKRESCPSVRGPARAAACLERRGRAALRALVAAAALAGCGGGTTYIIEPDSCARLFDAVFDDVRLTRARIEPASSSYKEHCLVEGTTRAGRVAFELRMPFAGDWNGRLLMQGTGGYSGQVDPAIGGYRTPTGPGLLADGYAVATTDTGHTGVQAFETYFLPLLDGSWAFDNPEAEEDFAWRGMRAATLAAQQVLKRLQQRDRFRTYYVGCSGAGRIGMKMAEKAPELYDGFVIGDPPVSLSREMIRMHWNVTTTSVLPLPLAKMRLIGRTTLQRCDALDGAADGVVSDPLACRFNPFDLVCSGADGPDCLTPDQAIAAHRIYQGPVDALGGMPAFGLPASGAEDCDGLCDGNEEAGLRFKEGWPWWFSGGPISSLDAHVKPPEPLTVERSFGHVLMSHYFRYLAFDPDKLDLRWQDLDPVNRPGQLDRARDLYDVRRTDYGEFARNGKRVLMYSGWGDAFVSPLGVIDFFERVQRSSGGAAATADFMRLFMVPGMQHCEGGRSLDDFDAVGTLVRWVEDGKAPDTMRARNRWDVAFPGRTRDLCPHPAVSVYRGSGSFDDPASFECRVPVR